MLRREVEALRARLGTVGKGRDTPASTPAAPASAAAAAPKAPEPEPAQPAVSTYVVQTGDNLSRIAEKMYGSSARWADIYEANRSALKSPESVRVGQTLIIPK